jgi:hypothetical protein
MWVRSLNTHSLDLFSFPLVWVLLNLCIIILKCCLLMLWNACIL